MAQIFIDGVEQTSGQLAAFGEDGLISALDANGTSYFPPSDINIYELSLWSNSASGEVVTFKYFDIVNNIIIDLNESYTFVSNDVIGDGFDPFILTADFTPCDCDGNVFDDCGVCGGTGLDVDADGICDDIDECVGDFDDCGICNGGNIDLDDCGVCFGNNEDQDCNGDCFGTAIVDDCNICSGGNTGLEFNADLDDCGVCYGNNENLDCAGDCASDTPVGCEDKIM